MKTTCTKCGRTFMFKSRARSDNHSCLDSKYHFKNREVNIKNKVVKTMTIKSIVDGYYEVKDGDVWKLIDSVKVVEDEVTYDNHVLSGV